MSEIVAAELSLIEYIDLAGYTDFQTSDFFSSDQYTVCTLTIVGWALDVVIDGLHLVKIVFVNDEDGDENSEGMVIPISCITKRMRLEAIEDAVIINETEEKN